MNQDELDRELDSYIKQRDELIKKKSSNNNQETESENPVADEKPSEPVQAALEVTTG